MRGVYLRSLDQNKGQERHFAKEPLGAEPQRQVTSRGGWGRNYPGEGAREAQGRGKHREGRREQKDKAVPIPAETLSSCRPHLSHSLRIP